MWTCERLLKLPCLTEEYEDDCLGGLVGQFADGERERWGVIWRLIGAVKRKRRREKSKFMLEARVSAKH